MMMKYNILPLGSAYVTSSLLAAVDKIGRSFLVVLRGLSSLSIELEYLCFCKSNARYPPSITDILKQKLIKYEIIWLCVKDTTERTECENNSVWNWKCEVLSSMLKQQYLKLKVYEVWFQIKRVCNLLCCAPRRCEL